MRPCTSNFVDSTNYDMQERIEKDCPFCGQHISSTKSGFGNHIRYCKLNPDRCEAHKPHFSEESRKKLSETLKKAHAEGRASTWKSRYKCEHSYPENWFIGVINNEFTDKNYICELPVGKWFLDFAWPEKMRYIEIDGQQHERYSERKQNDLKKDEFCKNLGWSVLRLSWSFICNNKQEAIKIAKDFIDTGKTCEIKWISKQQIKAERKNNLLSQGKIDSLGRANIHKLSEIEWLKRKDTILNCGVNLLSFGWKTKVIEKTGLSKREVENTVKKYNLEVFKTSRYKS